MTSILAIGNERVEITEKEKALPIMYWIPKMQKKNPIGAPFRISIKIWSEKQISKSASNTFKLVYSPNENFLEKVKFFIKL